MKTYFKAAKLMTEKADAEETLEDVMEVSIFKPHITASHGWFVAAVVLSTLMGFTLKIW